MSDYDRFQHVLKRTFVPILRNEGFKGSLPTFRRINLESIQIVNVQGSSYGGKCCLNMGLHYKFLPTAGGAPVSDWKKLKEYQCVFHRRVCEPGKSDQWWSYGSSEDESTKSVAHMIETYDRYGSAFFKKFEPFPDVFERISPSNLDAGDRSQLPIPMSAMSELHAALIIARIMFHLGHNDRCREFAAVGLRHLGRFVAFKPELERLIDAGS